MHLNCVWTYYYYRSIRSFRCQIYIWVASLNTRIIHFIRNVEDSSMRCLNDLLKFHTGCIRIEVYALIWQNIITSRQWRLLASVSASLFGKKAKDSTWFNIAKPLPLYCTLIGIVNSLLSPSKLLAEDLEIWAFQQDAEKVVETEIGAKFM